MGNKFKWDEADILELTDNIMFKIMQQRSLEDRGGVDRETMLRLGQMFMRRAFGLEVSLAPFVVDTDGNCLPNTLHYIANPTKNQQETAEGGTALRKRVISEALNFIRNASPEELESVQVAASGGDLTASLTKEELLEKIGQYGEDGVWAGDLGDIMPQIYASFSNTPVFIIAHSATENCMVGYFLKPAKIFKQTTLRPPSPVMIYQRHYEPLVIPRGSIEAWDAIYEGFVMQELQMALGIRVQLSEEDLTALRGGPTAAAGERSGEGQQGSFAGERSGEQRQQGSSAGAGDKFAFVTIAILRNVFGVLM